MSQNFKYQHSSEQKDAWLCGRSETALLLNNRLNQYEFDVHVEKCVVTLSGEVNTTIDEWLCLEILKGIKEIKQVISHLTVVELELLPEPDNQVTSRQAFFHWYNDTNITAEVKSKLLWNSKLSGKEIGVNTEQGVVTLSGYVDYAANRAMAELITAQITQVVEVKNNIRVNS